MAGLNNLLSDTQQTTTTLPSWYDTAQQNIVNQGQQAFASAPQFSQTTGQQAVNTLQGPANPFTQAQNTLQQISSGAANPWITDASGNVTPDTSTAMGGLFAAQRNQLNQLLPNYTAPVEGGNIASGNFGSLRGQTAVDKAKADAFANLNAQQLQAALTNQQTGSTAAANLGNVGSQGISSEMNVGTAQQNAPYQNIGNLATLLGTIQAPTTVSSQKQMSPLTQAATLANTLQGTGVAGGLGSLLFGSPATATKAATAGIIPGATGGLTSLWTSLFGGSGSGATQSGSSLGGGTTPGTYTLADGGSMTVNADGSKTITAADGTPQYFDASGNAVSSDQGLQNANIIPDSSTTQQSSSAGDTSAIDNVDYSQYTGAPAQ